MAQMRVEGGRYEARCEHCGKWRAVEPRETGAEAFFVHWQAVFTCCGARQTASFTTEKDEIDIH